MNANLPYAWMSNDAADLGRKKRNESAQKSVSWFVVCEFDCLPRVSGSPVVHHAGCPLC